MENNISIGVVWHVSLVQKIQKRLTRVLVSCLEKAKYDRKTFVPPKPKPSVQDFISSSRHNLVNEHSSFRCSDCCSSVSRSSPNFLNWLKSPCFALPYNDSIRAVPIPKWYTVQVSNTVPHHSHNLYSIRGIIFCTTCGAFSAKKCRLLASLCHNACSVSSLRAKNKLLRAELPVKGMRWPRLDCNLCQPVDPPLATDTHLADQTALVGSSVVGESCPRIVDTSHFDNPDFDFLLDESFFDA